MVIKFIENFKRLHPKEIEECFSYGNCYWFAVILSVRFRGTIWYLPVENHFVTKIGMKYYDITGKVNLSSIPHYKWDNYRRIEPAESKRIFKHCILQV